MRKKNKLLYVEEITLIFVGQEKNQSNKVMMTLKKHLLAATMLMVASAGFAQSYTTKYEPTKENLEARKEFQDQKFGIFLHWGIYSMTAQGEWYLNVGQIDRNEYAKLASGFYPSKFNAAEWVSAIKASGAKYITITSRHHDGFSMFGTKQSDYNIVDATPFHRDVLKELSEECKKQGIKLHFYYSHLDWIRDDYPEGNTGHFTGRPAGHGDYNSYFNFMNNQLTELLTNYGPIGAIWFDGLWDHDKDFNWRLDEQYTLIHKLQPSCLIGNNHHRNPYSGEDFQMFERDLPGQNVTGYSKGTDISQLPLETCETMNGMWGYKIQDQNYKTTEQLIHYLVKAAGMNANLLMNIGPQPNGELPAVAVQRLKEVGQWMNTYGETIYGTRGGDVSPHDWGVSTRKGNKLYIHIINLKDKALYIPLEAKVQSAARFIDKKAISYKALDGGYLLLLPEIPTDVDYVVELTLR